MSRSPCDLIPATSLPDGSWVIPLGPSPQALCTCGSLCRLSPGTPSFENCIILPFLSFRLDGHLLREAFPDPQCKAAPQAFCLLLFFFPIDLSATEMVSSLFPVCLPTCNGSSTKPGTWSDLFLGFPRGLE